MCKYFWIRDIFFSKDNPIALEFISNFVKYKKKVIFTDPLSNLVCPLNHVRFFQRWMQLNWAREIPNQLNVSVVPPQTTVQFVHSLVQLFHCLSAPHRPIFSWIWPRLIIRPFAIVHTNSVSFLNQVSPLIHITHSVYSTHFPSNDVDILNLSLSNRRIKTIWIMSRWLRNSADKWVVVVVVLYVSP